MPDSRPARLSVPVVFWPTSTVEKATELEYQQCANSGKELVCLFLEGDATRLTAYADFGTSFESVAMTIRFRIPKQIEREMRHSLAQSHPFAFERVGFVFTRLSRAHDGEILVLATAYDPVHDDDYIEDPRVGARINSAAIRKAMQRALSTGEGAFHVHIHDHYGITGPSHTDQQELRPMMRSIRNAAPQNAHGLLILSRDAAWAETLLPGFSEFQIVEKISTIGFPTVFVHGSKTSSEPSEHFARQSFLGPSSTTIFAGCHVGIVGLGGGGSHIAQQLAHAGFSIFSLFDHDSVERSNLNRLVGGTLKDATKGTPKVEVAARLIKTLNPAAKISKINERWQNEADRLRACDIVFGCVDSYAERRDLEISTRRYLIPYLDIGLDVHKVGDEPPRMAGQVILSMPGELCMSCMGFLTDSKLGREAEHYGAAGPRPQVVWANGVLASTAVGIAVDLITDWTQSLRRPVYLSYDSNTATMQSHKRLEYASTKVCPHFPLSEIGDPVFRQL